MKLNKPLIQFSGPPEGGGGHVGVARQQHKQTKVKPQARGGQNHNWKQQFPHLLPAVFIMRTYWQLICVRSHFRV